MPRAVLDSTVLISAFLAQHGVSNELLRHARAGAFLLCLSEEILAEAMDVLLEHLGPQKTAELWHVIAPPGGDYLKLRKQLFAGKDVHTIFMEAKRFNRKQPRD